MKSKVSIGRLKRKNKSENITHYTCHKNGSGFDRKNFSTSVRAYAKGIVSSLICGEFRLDHKTSHEFLTGPTICRNLRTKAVSLKGKHGQENSPEGNRKNLETNPQGKETRGKLKPVEREIDLLYLEVLYFYETTQNWNK